MPWHKGKSKVHRMLELLRCRSIQTQTVVPAAVQDVVGGGNPVNNNVPCRIVAWFASTLELLRSRRTIYAEGAFAGLEAPSLIRCSYNFSQHCSTLKGLNVDVPGPLGMVHVNDACGGESLCAGQQAPHRIIHLQARRGTRLRPALMLRHACDASSRAKRRCV